MVPTPQLTAAVSKVSKGGMKHHLAREVMTEESMKHNLLNEMASNSIDVLNPFVHRIKLTTFHKVKAAIMTVTVLPLRFILTILLMSMTWVIMKIALIGVSEKQLEDKPIIGWRRKYMKPPAAFIARLVFVLCGWHWARFKGKRASFKEAPILVIGPHSSFFDAVPCIKLGCPGMVVKDSTKKAPIFGSVIKFAQPVFVSRGDSNSRQNTVQEIKRRCTSGDEWEQIIIFPEGTCTNRSCLISFKLGAFYPGVPVQPVILRYPNSLDTLTWTWDGPGALKQLWLTFSQFHIFCEIEFLPVYHPSEAEQKDPKLFADNVREVMARALGVPVSNYSLDDIKYLSLTTQSRFPNTVGLVKILKLRSKLGYKSEVTSDEITSYTEKWKLHSPLCTLKEFSDYLKDTGSDALREFFDVVDQDKKGRIDYRIYVAGLWLLKLDIIESERLKNAFKVFNSTITSHSFESISFLWLGLSKKGAAEIYFHLTHDKYENISFDDVKMCFVKKIKNGQMHHDSNQNENGFVCFNAMNDSSPPETCKVKSV